MTCSTDSSPEKSHGPSPDTTSSVLHPTLIVKLHCGCTMTESVNRQLTRTSLELWRTPTCKRLSHFTGKESGWLQIADAVKATTLLSDVSFERLGADDPM